MKSKIYLFLSIILFSCNSKNEGGAKETLTIPEETNINLSEIIESFTFIPLDNKESIGNVEYLNISPTTFTVKDYVTKSVLAFDSNGKFKYKIHRVGRGPGEYIEISDILIKNDTLEIIDGGNKKRLFFDKNGNFISESKSNSYAWKYIYLNNKEILDFTDPGGGGRKDKKSNYLNIWDSKLLNIKKSELSFAPYKDKYLGVDLYPFSRYKNTINFSSDFSDIIYSIDTKGVPTPKYKLVFSNNKWPTEDVYKKYYDKDIFEWSSGMKKYVQYLRFIESEEHCFLNFAIEDKRKNYFYNKSKKTAVCVNKFTDDIGLGTTNLDIVGHLDGYWYAVIRISEMDNLEVLKKTGYVISDNSEFVIVKFKLR